MWVTYFSKGINLGLIGCTTEPQTSSWLLFNIVGWKHHPIQFQTVSVHLPPPIVWSGTFKDRRLERWRKKWYLHVITNILHHQLSSWLLRGSEGSLANRGRPDKPACPYGESTAYILFDIISGASKHEDLIGRSWWSGWCVGLLEIEPGHGLVLPWHLIQQMAILVCGWPSFEECSYQISQESPLDFIRFQAWYKSWTPCPVA